MKLDSQPVRTIKEGFNYPRFLYSLLLGIVSLSFALTLQMGSWWCEQVFFFLSLFYFTCVRSHNSCASTCSSFHFALTGKLDVKSFYWDEKSANKWGRLWGKFHRISFELHKVDFWVLIKLGIKKCNNLQCSRMQEDKGLAFLISHDILPTLVWFPICFAFRKITWFFFLNLPEEYIKTMYIVHCVGQHLYSKNVLPFLKGKITCLSHI